MTSKRKRREYQSFGSLKVIAPKTRETVSFHFMEKSFLFDKQCVTQKKTYRGNSVHQGQAMCRFWGRVDYVGSIVHNITLHFCQRLFLRFEIVTSSSYDDNSYLGAKDTLHVRESFN